MSIAEGWKCIRDWRKHNLPPSTWIIRSVRVNWLRRVHESTWLSIWCRILFSLIDSASMCLRGPHSSFHAPENEINFSDHAINWHRPQRGPAGGLTLPQLADNLTDHLTDHPIIPLFPWVLYYNVHVLTCVCTASQAVRMCAWLIITETGKNCST